MDAQSSTFIGLAQSGYHTLKDGCKIYFEVYGNGPQKIVLIQGLQTSLLTWQYQVEYFVSDEKKRYQVLLIDNRGYGKSDRPEKLFTTRRLAKDAYSVIKNELKWVQFHLVGHSMGGMIAMELAMLDPKSIQSLALVVAHAGGISAFPPFEGIGKLLLLNLTRKENPEDIAEALLRVQYPKLWLESKFEGTQKTNRELMIEKLVKDLKWGCPTGFPPPSGAVGQLSALARHYVPTAALHRLKRHMSSQGSPIIVSGVRFHR